MARTPEQKAAWAAYMREWNRRNPDKVKANRERRREQRNAVTKAWRARNKEHVQAYRRANRQAENTRTAAYKRRNPLKRREWEARRRARLRANGIEPVDYQAVIQKTNGHCGICGAFVAETEREFDHIIPIALGGPHTFENLQVSHATCNTRKGAAMAA